MSNSLLNFKDKKDRNDFFIALLVILFFGWLLYFFGFHRSDDFKLFEDEVEIAGSTIDTGDSDNDGILNSKDKCPFEPGLALANGCPQDADGDGVDDFYDRCPNTRGNQRNEGCPESRDKDLDGDGFVGADDLCPDIAGSDNGCPAKAATKNEKITADKAAILTQPVIADKDGDGVADAEDKCPQLAGIAANSGCPSDRDKDGVYDKDDKCPNVKGTATNNGCPAVVEKEIVEKPVVADKDGDGVLDADDKCPNRAGPASSNGCPEVKMTTEEKKVVADAINKVVFLPSSANLTEYSKGLVIKISALMKKYPDAKLKISGHTDSLGQEGDNLTLSKNRAETCLNLIAKQGIDRDRMSFEGFGESKPVAANTTKEGRQKNRRVEFELFY